MIILMYMCIHTFTAARSAGTGDCNLGKNQVKNQVKYLVKNQVKTQVFLEAEGLTGNLGFLEDGDLRTLGKCTGDHWKSREHGIWNLGKNLVKTW